MERGARKEAGGRAQTPYAGGMEQRPQGTFGLIKHLVQLRWQKLGRPGRTLATVAGIALALSAFAAASSCMIRGCLFGGCPYQQSATHLETYDHYEHPVLEAGELEADVEYECPHSRR